MWALRIWSEWRVVLGYGDALKALFKPKIDSLDDILRYEKSATRQRVKRKK
ncbi:Uncharacterised protein [Citrobacter koseri]|uniref:Uncharacterized protein n=1 Tax=Citrobacter koseri TaxID=545 RepID=A0A2X2W8W1_CITKO|nr:Uncharacterised protein [Citrobacter koseri]